jgi:hypothetical protein
MKSDVDQGIQGDIHIQTCFKAHSVRKPPYLLVEKQISYH